MLGNTFPSFNYYKSFQISFTIEQICAKQLIKCWKPNFSPTQRWHYLLKLVKHLKICSLF